MRRGVNDYFAKRDGNIGDIGRFGFAPVSPIQRDRFSSTEARMGRTSTQRRRSKRRLQGEHGARVTGALPTVSRFHKLGGPFTNGSKISALCWARSGG